MDALQDVSARQLARLARNELPSCKICAAPTRVFDVLDFGKICGAQPYRLGLSGVPVYYFRCGDCGFTFTDFVDRFSAEDFAAHLYNDDYLDIDPDYAHVRPALNALEILSFLGGERGVLGLDYGGGNGRTASLLREAGLAYDTFDPFGATTVPADRIGRYDFCSSFEVFEHTADPVGTFQAIVDLCAKDRVILYVGTGTTDRRVSEATRLQWDYAAPRNGHVSLHSIASLDRLGARFGFDCWHTPGAHVFFKGVDRRRVLAKFVRGKLVKQLKLIARRLGR